MTWGAWKDHYHVAYIAYKWLLAAGCTSISSGVAHLPAADATIQLDTISRLDGYLNNLAAAATIEQTTLNQLIDNNTTLTANMATLTVSLAAMNSAFTFLVSNMNAPTTAAAPSLARTPTTTAVDTTASRTRTKVAGTKTLPPTKIGKTTPLDRVGRTR
jgi:hypothetical protein